MSFNLNEEILRLEGYSFDELQQLAGALRDETGKKKEQEELVQLKAQANTVANAASADLRDELKTLKDMLDESWLF